jgi:hypothetical protein
MVAMDGMTRAVKLRTWAVRRSDLAGSPICLHEKRFRGEGLKPARVDRPDPRPAPTQELQVSRRVAACNRDREKR